MTLLLIRALPAAPPADPRLRAFRFDGPARDAPIESDGFEVDGWILGRAAPPVAIEVVDGDGAVRCRAAVGRERPDVAAAFSGAVGADRSGFRGWVPAAGLDARFSLQAVAVLDDGDRVPLGAIAGERVPFPADAAADEAAAAEWPGPNFLVIGTQRGGTTSFYDYLSQHPLVVPAADKELKFFSAFFDRGPGWYRARFPRELPAGAVTGEATPYYLFHPHAPRRAAAVAPRARLIALLRDPVDRAYSHYQHERARGTEPLAFAAAIDAEAERLRGEEARMRADEGYGSLAHQNRSYLARGRYADQLRAWLAHFLPEQILVLRSEDLYANVADTVRRATDFLGLPPAPLADTRPRNQAPYPKLDAELRRRLNAHFAESNADLEALLAGSPMLGPPRPQSWGS